MFQQRIQNMSTGQKPVVREARRENLKPRKLMPKVGVPAMGPQQGREAEAAQIDPLDVLVDRMRENGPPELPEAGPAPSVGAERGPAWNIAVERLMRARAAAMARNRI